MEIAARVTQVLARRHVIAGGMVVLSACALLPASVAAGRSYRFVSAPDSWNSDIGDVRGAVGWDPGEPNSINRSWRRAITAVLDEMALRTPRFVLVAGDLVEGEWDEDLDGYGTFGSIADLVGKRRAIRAAARTYYPQWRAQFRRHGLRVHAAMGDHEIGRQLVGRPIRARSRRDLQERLIKSIHVPAIYRAVCLPQPSAGPYAACQDRVRLSERASALRHRRCLPSAARRGGSHRDRRVTTALASPSAGSRTPGPIGSIRDRPRARPGTARRTICRFIQPSNQGRRIEPVLAHPRSA